jgi:hypothetical protein
MLRGAVHRSPDRGLREARRAAALIGFAAPAIVFASAALAATPKPGQCWGACGGPSGPIGGYFAVAHHHVSDFEDSQACLGANNGFEEYIQIPTSIPITAGGHFSFQGEAGIGNGQTITQPSVSVTLTGHFTTSRIAKVTLQIATGACTTPAHLKIHRNN